MEPKLTVTPAAVPDLKSPQTDPAAKVEQVTPAADARKAGQDEPRQDPNAQRGPDPSEMRLLIEKDQASGTYVYKTINRETGEVVSQLPRAEVLKFKDSAHYATGSVVRTKA